MPRLKEGCAFCRRVRDGDVTWVTGSVASFEPLNPVTPGHLLFVPAWHYEHPAPGIVAMCMQMAAEHGTASSEDYNLIVNAGRNASQTIPHIHVHLVPRREHDGLRLPWTGQEWRAR